MAITHHWLSDKLLHTCYQDKVTGEELIVAAREVAADPRFENIRFIIGDWREIKDAQISPDDIRELAAYILALAKSFPMVKNASLVAGYESGEARASLYDILLKGCPWDTATFATFEEALDWFCIDQTFQPKLSL